jgi:hypothetical protein
MAKQDPTQLIIYVGLGYAIYHYGKQGKLGQGISDLLNGIPAGGGGTTKPCAFDANNYVADLGVNEYEVREWQVVIGSKADYRTDVLADAQGWFNYRFCGAPKPVLSQNG